MGGYIALNMIKRYPERIQALILCDTQCLADTPAGKEKRYKTMLQVASEGLEEFAEGFVQNAISSHSKEINPELTETVKSIILGTPVQTITETLEALATREDTCGILHTIKVPTLIICGSEDKLTPPPLSEFMHSNINNSRLEIIEKAGHLSNLENPKLFNKYL
jgi:pimeloyl-ACP methyl ester carboxylesterase